MTRRAPSDDGKVGPRTSVSRPAGARPGWRVTLGAYLPLLLLVGFLTWFGTAQATDRFWITLGIQALWTAVAVIGLNILLGYAGLLSLGHYAFFLYGGFIGAIWSVQDWGLSPWLGFPLAFAAGMVLGALLALTCCHLHGFYVTVVTLAFGLIASALALLFESLFNGLSGRSVDKPLDTNFWFLDASNPNRPFVGLYWIGVVILLVCLYMSWNLVHSRWGRGYKAIRESEVAARLSGIPAYWYKVSAFRAVRRVRLARRRAGRADEPPGHDGERRRDRGPVVPVRDLRVLRRARHACRPDRRRLHLHARVRHQLRRRECHRTPERVRRAVLRHPRDRHRDRGPPRDRGRMAGARIACQATDCAGSRTRPSGVGGRAARRAPASGCPTGA